MVYISLNNGTEAEWVEHYKSEEFREYFESLGTRVIYLDAGVSVEYSKEQAREFYVEVFDKEP